LRKPSNLQAGQPEHAAEFRFGDAPGLQFFEGEGFEVLPRVQ
jgi:hypothetical protein